MSVLDFNIVQVALATIRSDLGVSYAASEWIISIYGIPLAGFLIMSGRIGDLYGRKKVFAAGLIVFAVASLVAGLSVSELMLIVARAVQGLGAALFSATALAIVAAAFEKGKNRERAVSIYVACGGIGAIAGLTLGGVMTATLGWRSIMLVNVPVGIVGALLALGVLGPRIEQKHRNKAGSTSSKLDLPGAIAVTSGLLLFVFALTQGTSTGFGNDETILPLGLSILVFAFFFWNETRAKSPLVPLDLIRKRTQLSANLGGIVAPGAYSGLIFIVATYMQTTQHLSALFVGLAFAPAGVCFAASSGYLARQLSHRIGVKYVLISGMILMAMGFALLVRISPGASYYSVLLPALLVFTIGTGICFTTAQIMAVSDIGESQEGIASGIINTSRYIGIPVGLAVLVAVGKYAFPIGAALTAASALGIYCLKPREEK